MPYTPPSQSRSPASSAPSSPDVSRRSSFQSSPRPSLPRSASYLTKQRRTPPAATGPVTNGTSDQPTPPGTSDDLKGMATSSSVRQSPPPVTDERGMPKGAIISPPDSGSEEEDVAVRGRQLDNLRELKDAISQIPVHREASPSAKPEQPTLALVINDEPVKDGIPYSFSTGSLETLAKSVARRAGHIRSSTEPKIIMSKSAEASLTNSEEESDEETPRKPQMVRKKSGELVRPALRPPSRRRPSSMPGTPTFSKAVHFDSHLEHVRHFLQVDRPLAVSAGSSPADNYDSDTEYPFPGDEQRPGARTPPYEWEIVTANHPADTPIRKALPVRLERVWLSSDQKNLLGSIGVANLAFQKSVTCRFTLDYWKTTSEVGAEYSHEVRPHDGGVAHDRFTFTIKLSDLANLETKTLFFCIRYNVNGQEYWDNNYGTNFQVDFRKKYLPQNGKRGLQGAAGRPALPRSNRRASPASAPRPKSMNVGFDDFGHQSKLNFDQPIHEYLGESGPNAGLRLKSNKSTGNLASDNLSSRLSAPSGQAFANRYDFGASLTAAVQAAKDSMGKDRNPDGLYMKSHRKIQVPVQQPQQPKATTTSKAPAVSMPVMAPAAPGTDSPNTSLASSSYEELVNKYCFFGSKQSSPQIKDGTLRSGKFDGADEAFVTRGTNSTNSSTNGSPSMAHHAQHAGPAQHHSFHLRDSNPYFQQLGSYGASPASSPLSHPVHQERPATQRPSHAPTSATMRSASSAAPVGGFPFAGLFITEALHPFNVFKSAGFEVDLVSETGTYRPDWLSQHPDWLPDKDRLVWEDHQSEFRSKLDRLLKPQDIDPAKYGIFFASAGHASLIDYPTAEGLQSVASKMYADGSVISSVCHGGAIFPGIIDPATKKPIIWGKKVTGFTTKGEEEEGVLETIKSWGRPTIEASAASAGAVYIPPPGPWDAFTHTDGRIVTGANPASAAVTAEAAVGAFNKL
ncbi:Glyoxalase 3-like protein 1 [Colletotrichum chlorophyti]|uniref:Glyoxalase 3-like protein 1 n=1 Tax=Colletotrichum chlorophyti TaxID=708187 RepID=A0A1Q8RGL4_9PEZI|nr:Glyoxalase 3-like protein 1 [Colletotrichum chlorophyti]